MLLRWSPFAALVAVGCNSSPPAGDAGIAPSSRPAAAADAPSASGTAPAPAPSASSTGAPAADPTRLTVDGKPTQGAVLRAKVSGRVKNISFPGHKTTILDDGEFLIGFAREAPAKERLALTLDDGTVLVREFEVAQRTYEIDRIDGLPKSQVDLDAATKKKLAEAEGKLDALRMKFGDGVCFKETFAWPVRGKIASRYGQPRVLNGTESGPHYGVDIVAPVGAAVRAPACGKVVFVGRNLPLSGNVLVLDHGRGLTSTFIHLQDFKRKENDVVHQGDELATVGLTGRTNGPHLHWGMNVYDLRVDPELLVPPMQP